MLTEKDIQMIEEELREIKAKREQMPWTAFLLLQRLNKWVAQRLRDIERG